MHDQKARPAGTAAARSKTSVTRQRRGLGPAARTPSEAWAQQQRVTSHPTFPTLGAPQQMLSVMLLVWCDQDALCFPPVQVIADRLGVHKRRIQAHLGSLGEVGFISFPRGRAGGSSLDTTLVRVDAALPRGDETSTLTDKAGDESVIPEVSKSAPLRVTKSAPKPKEVEPKEETDDARETASSISDEHKPFRDQIFANLKPSAEQRQLIDEGFTHNPNGVRHCWHEAQKGRNPNGLFLKLLARLKDDGWNHRDRRSKTVDPAVLLNTAVRLCCLYYGDRSAFEDEIAAHVAKGVDEQQLRAAVAEQHANHAAPADDNVVDLFQSPVQPDDATADAA